jgi:hypothetical protein
METYRGTDQNALHNLASLMTLRWTHIEDYSNWWPA